MTWIPLHVHSQYSILEASASIQQIAAKACQMAMPAVALTDYGNMFASVDFFKACKAVGVKPIIGCSLYVAPNSRFEKKRIPGGKTSYQIILLARNAKGYHNLCKLSSKGYMEGFYYHPRVDKELLKECSEGLVCLSGGLGGSVSFFASRGEQEKFMEEVLWYREVYGENYYLELQRHQSSEESLKDDGMFQETWLVQNYYDFVKKQEKVNRALMEVSEELKISCVATNASHYMERADWKAHEILLNVQSGEPCEMWEKDSLGNNKRRIPNPKRRVYFSHEFYFKSPDQMKELFHDIPKALQTTLEISEKCSIDLDFVTTHYPSYVPPLLKDKEYTEKEQSHAVGEYLTQLCKENIPKRYTQEHLKKVQEKYSDKKAIDVVHKRLEDELEIIISKNLCDYLLIVWDFIHWAKSHSIPVGPGRGSGAGSIILYLIGVTDIEPLRFNLFFERFINPERMSYPDIDVDICMDRRNDVIDYTLQKYGRENVAQIVTFGSMKAKMAIKDVGRVLNVPLSKVNIIAKLIPEDLNMTIEKALDVDADLYRMYKEDEETTKIIDIGRKLEGSIRNTGVHAAGVIISGEPLTDHIPLCKSKDSDIAVTQFSMKPVEAVGMLKVDFLGLKTLTCIQKAVDALKLSEGREIDYMNLPLDDEAAFNLLNQGNTLGIFQLESAGMQELARKLHLDTFEEIIAVVSLYRPGPMDMIPSFIARKHGHEKIEYDHEWLREILSETYGIMVYQEQVMQIAQKLANYSLGEGDVLRRAMGKKDMKEMVQQREKFVQGAIKNEIEKEKAEIIFDKMEKFAAYGFNKSHAAAYGYLSYITAYMKANYPREWMAALMTCDRDDLSKVAKFIRECQAMDIPILPPDINEAGSEFVATSQGIRFAMLGIKGIGEGVVEAIVQEREKGGPFNSLYHFIQRMDLRKVGKKVIENLIGAGSFDFTQWSREALKESIETMYDAVSKEKKEAAQGVMNLFSLMEEEGARFNKMPEVKNKLSKYDILMKEKELLGFFLTGHPMETYQPILARLSCTPLHEVEKLDHDTIFRGAFIVEAVQVRIASKSQRKFAIVMISDGMERYELPIWSDLYEEKGHLLQENQLLYAVLQVDKRERSTKLSCKWFDNLRQADESVIESCDRAYDKAKMMLGRFNLYSKNKKTVKKPGEKEAKKVENKVVESKEKILKMKIDADSAHLSHILRLKELFKQHSGTSPISIDFCINDDAVAALEVASNWGVEITAELKRRVKEIPSIMVCRD